MSMEATPPGVPQPKTNGLAIASLVLGILAVLLCGVAIVLIPVVGLLAAIAIPNFVKAREASQRAACISNLRSIDGAKAVWALENKKVDGTIPSSSDLFGPGKQMANEPACPAGGNYSLGAVGERPTCTIARHEMP